MLILKDKYAPESDRMFIHPKDNVGDIMIQIGSGVVFIEPSQAKQIIDYLQKHIEDEQ